jgi:hypothetical protein
MPARSATALVALALSALAVIWIPHATGSPGGQALTVDNANAYGGAVTSSPAEISCGNHCTGTFASGSTVTLTATPREEDAFSGFHGDCSGPAPRCTLTMDAAKTVHVNFFGFTFDGVKLRERRGTGLIAFKVGARGELDLSGEGVEARELPIPSAGVYSLAIVPNGTASRTLKKSGRARVRFRAAFTPLGGAPAGQQTTVLMRRVPAARRAPVSLSCTRRGAHGNETIWACGARH